VQAPAVELVSIIVPVHAMPVQVEVPEPTKPFAQVPQVWSEAEVQIRSDPQPVIAVQAIQAQAVKSSGKEET